MAALPLTTPLAQRRSATIQTCRKGSTGVKSTAKNNYVPTVASPTSSTSTNTAHPTCTTNTTPFTHNLLPVASALISPLQTSSNTAPATTDNTSTWLAPLLRARQASEQHVQLCEQALVRDEGFTDAALFGAVLAKPSAGDTAPTR